MNCFNQQTNKLPLIDKAQADKITWKLVPCNVITISQTFESQQSYTDIQRKISNTNVYQRPGGGLLYEQNFRRIETEAPENKS